MLDVFALFPVLFVLVFIIIIISVAINFYRVIRGRPIQEVGVVKEREIIREIVKIRCPYCNNLYDETYDKCPYCGGKR